MDEYGVIYYEEVQDEPFEAIVACYRCEDTPRRTVTVYHASDEFYCDRGHRMQGERTV